MAGGFEGTAPPAGGAAAAPAGSTSGSALVEGAVGSDMTRHMATSTARRMTTAIGLTHDNVRTRRFE
ncbi:hypothetical protein MMAN_57560 [Mycobacterium mantenii]|uniref:Uncharacterized protein n=1 Tax=Mycobacterium mantenii TaxID=560555 RepID=A0ABM7K1A8_MYCNT|nr:hypothetical protein MMAN_57560 [Mycobacterium mantenii]